MRLKFLDLTAYLFTLYLLLSPVSLVTAQEKSTTSLIQVYPSILSLSLQPGKTQEYQVTIRNASRQPMPIRLSLESFQLHDDDKSQTPPPTLSAWTTVLPEDMLLASGEAKTVTVTTKLPPKIPLGGYYGNIIIEPKSASAQDLRTSAQVQPKLVVLLLGSIGVPNPASDNGTVRDGEKNWVYFTNRLPIQFEVKNTSLYHFSGKPFIKLKPLLGEQHEFELEEKLVLPGRTRVWDTTVEATSDYHLIYRKIIAVSVGGGEKIITQRLILLLPKQLGLALLGVAALLSAFVLFHHRSRFRSALKILLTGKDPVNKSNP
jgi:hypothetical protein